MTGTAEPESERIERTMLNVIELFAVEGLTYEEGLSVMTWVMAELLYKEGRPELDLSAAMHRAIETALRQIERREKKGRVPLA